MWTQWRGTLAITIMVSLSSMAQTQQPLTGREAAAVAAEPEAPRVVLQAETTASVLRLMKFSALLRDRAGHPRSGAVGLTFALYKDQQAGSPLWLETHNAQLDEQGRYTVLLGSTRSEGLPLELFSSGEARWLGVQVNLPGEEEQARVLLVSVPYALKAADAETLGGKPPSAFVLAEKQEAAGTKAEAGKETMKEGPERQLVINGTPGRIAKFVGPAADDVGNSVMTESGGNIGVDNPSPTAKLDVLGGFGVAAFRGNASDTVVRLENLAAGGSSWDIVATSNSSALGGGKFSIAKSGVSHIFTIEGNGNVAVGSSSSARFTVSTSNPAVATFRGNNSDAVMTFSNSASEGSSWDLMATASGSAVGPGRFSIAQTGGAHFFTIDNTGQVGLANITPAARLDVKGTFNVAAFRGNSPDAVMTFQNQASGGASWDMVATATGSTAGSGKFSIAKTGVAHFLTIDGAGNMGVGNVNPVAKLDVAGSVNATSATISGNLSAAFSTLVVDSTNNRVGMGTSSPTNILTVVQSSPTDPIADAWTVYSSRRWKTNIHTLEGGLDKVQRLRGVSYDRKADGRHDIGLIAEEVGQVVPEVVAYEENGQDAKSVDYARLTALLIEAVKEQQAQIRQLRLQVEQLRAGGSKELASARR